VRSGEVSNSPEHLGLGVVFNNIFPFLEGIPLLLKLSPPYHLTGIERREPSGFFLMKHLAT